MLIAFNKYHGTGNDFILIDDRGLNLSLSKAQIAQLCDRRFGVGADGLILLQEDDNMARMVYFNADGAEGSMCGNGARCFVAFGRSLGALSSNGEFLAVDGRHSFRTSGQNVSIQMADVNHIEQEGRGLFLDTGSPHYVEMIDDVLSLDVVKNGRAIRNNQRFREKGTNVNFVEMMEGALHIRTYERGVEDETLSCGTGVTASALIAHHEGWTTSTEMPVKTLGGRLNVSFTPVGNGRYTEIWLTGPAKKVFAGEIAIRT